jgi:hypothetical protein
MTMQSAGTLRSVDELEARSGRHAKPLNSRFEPGYFRVTKVRLHEAG